MLRMIHDRSEAFLAQLECFKAEILATRCRVNIRIPSRVLEIFRSGKRLPAVIKMTPVQHRPQISAVEMDPFNSDGWYV
jgi:hypothetical protein